MIVLVIRMLLQNGSKEANAKLIQMLNDGHWDDQVGVACIY